MERMWLLRGVGLLALSLVLADTGSLAGQLPDTQLPDIQSPAPRMSEEAALQHFEKKVRPILASLCYECHSADAVEIRGGLALDTREGIRRGGDMGPAVVPGDVRSSLLIKAIRHQDVYDMPPDGKLTEQQIADLVAWVEAGAVDPRPSSLHGRLDSLWTGLGK